MQSKLVKISLSVLNIFFLVGVMFSIIISYSPWTICAINVFGYGDCETARTWYFILFSWLIVFLGFCGSLVFATSNKFSYILFLPTLLAFCFLIWEFILT